MPKPSQMQLEMVMPALLWFRLAIARVALAAFVAVCAYLALAAIDVLFGTTLIFALWQWLATLWLFLLKWLKFLARFGLRWLPNAAKRFVVRKGLSGISKIATTFVLAGLFWMLGGDRYRRYAVWVNRSKSATIQLLKAIWATELWFFPKWLRAVVFIIAVVVTLIVFAQIQEWAESRHAPSFYGIDPWSFLFGLVASFFLTNLPLIGFDHFLSQIFRPLQRHYRRLIRRRGVMYAALNWLMALRPARRRAELERKRFMRRWHANDRARRLRHNAGHPNTEAPRRTDPPVPRPRA